MKSNIYSIIFLVSVFLAFAGCSDEFMDINEDPNNPVEVPLNQLLPTVQLDIAESMSMASSGLSDITSTFTHQITQRGTLNDYIVTGEDYEINTPWDNLYLAALTDIREIINQGTVSEDWHYVGIAQILKAYTFSIMVDLWGSVPYTEANLGSENTSPSYQNGEVIYDSVFVLLDKGIANLDQASNLSPANDDLIYKGDLSKWVKFANTLKLKLYNQIRTTRDVSSQVNALLSSGSLIESMADDFEMAYGTSENPDNRNPGYAQEYTRGSRSYQMNPYFYEVLKGVDTFGHGGNIFEGVEDPRIPYYFYNQLIPGEEPVNPPAYLDEETGFLGIYAFSYDIDPNEGHDQGDYMSVLGLYPVGGKFDDGSGETVDFNGVAVVPQRMLTFFARKYIEAELALTGVSNGNATALFEEALEASFDKVNQVANIGGAPQIDATAYIENVMELYEAASDEDKLQILMTQKWIASFGFGVDSYTDYRRTGYPVLHDGNSDNLAVTIRGRNYPVSLPYPSQDLQLNANAPSQRNVYTDRVFWDR